MPHNKSGLPFNEWLDSLKKQINSEVADEVLLSRYDEVSRFRMLYDRGHTPEFTLSLLF